MKQTLKTITKLLLVLIAIASPGIIFRIYEYLILDGYLNIYGDNKIDGLIIFNIFLTLGGIIYLLYLLSNKEYKKDSKGRFTK